MTVLLQRLADAKAEGWDQWIRDESDERAVREGHRFDLASAERVRDFFRKFQQSLNRRLSQTQSIFDTRANSMSAMGFVRAEH